MSEKTSLAKRYGESIRKELAHWKDLNENGGSDPFYEDGINMELTRNHIIWYRRKCEEELDPDHYPEEYYLEIPPEVDRHYMAKASEIPGRAAEALSIMEADPDYKYLRRVIGQLGDMERKQTCIAAVLGYVSGTRSAIQDGNLVEMRRKINVATYLESFRDCRRKCEEILKEPEVKTYPDGYQLTIFDVMNMA